MHNITAASSATYTAEYAPVVADLALTSWAKRGSGTALTFYFRVKNFGPAAALELRVQPDHRLPPLPAVHDPPRKVPAGAGLHVAAQLAGRGRGRGAVRSATPDPKPGNNRSRLRFPLT